VNKILNLLWQPLYWILAPVYYLLQMIIAIVSVTLFMLGASIIVFIAYLIKRLRRSINEPRLSDIFGIWLYGIMVCHREAMKNCAFVDDDDDNDVSGCYGGAIK
jgi:hypothetical protein